MPELAVPQDLTDALRPVRYMSVSTTVKVDGLLLPSDPAALQALLPEANGTELLTYNVSTPGLVVLNPGGQATLGGEDVAVACSDAFRAAFGREMVQRMQLAGYDTAEAAGSVVLVDCDALGQPAGSRRMLRHSAAGSGGEAGWDALKGGPGGRRGLLQGALTNCSASAYASCSTAAAKLRLQVSFVVPPNGTAAVGDTRTSAAAAAQQWRNDTDAPLLMCGSPACLDNVTLSAQLKVTRLVPLNAQGASHYAATCASNSNVANGWLCNSIYDAIAPPPVASQPPSPKVVAAGGGNKLAMVVGVAVAAGGAAVLLAVIVSIALVRRRRASAADLAAVKEAAMILQGLKMMTQPGSPTRATNVKRERSERMAAAAKAAAAATGTTTGMRWSNKGRPNDDVAGYDVTSGAPKAPRSRAGSDDEDSGGRSMRGGGVSRSGSIRRSHSIHRASFRQLQAANAAIMASITPTQRMVRNVSNRVIPAAPPKGILRQSSAKQPSDPGQAQETASAAVSPTGRLDRGVSDSGALRKPASIVHSPVSPMSAVPPASHATVDPRSPKSPLVAAAAALAASPVTEAQQSPRYAQGWAGADIAAQRSAPVDAATAVSTFSMAEIEEEEQRQQLQLQRLHQQQEAKAVRQQQELAEAERAAMRSSKQDSSWLAGTSMTAVAAALPAAAAGHASCSPRSNAAAAALADDNGWDDEDDEADGGGAGHGGPPGSAFMAGGNISNRRVRFALPSTVSANATPTSATASTSSPVTRFAVNPGGRRHGSSGGSSNAEDEDMSPPGTPERFSERSESFVLGDYPPAPRTNMQADRPDSLPPYPLGAAPVHGMLMLGRKVSPGRARIRMADDPGFGRSSTNSTQATTSPMAGAGAAPLGTLQAPKPPAATTPTASTSSVMWATSAPPPSQPPRPRRAGAKDATSQAASRDHRASAPGHLLRLDAPSPLPPMPVISGDLAAPSGSAAGMATRPARSAGGTSASARGERPPLGTGNWRSMSSQQRP